MTLLHTVRNCTVRLRGGKLTEIISRGETLPEAYHYALLDLEDFGKNTPCDDWNTTQKEVAMTMIVEEPLKEPMISKCFIGGPRELQQYVMEMLDGILDFEVGFGNWKYTYHERYIDQYQFIIDELRRNPSSRRAVMVIRDKIADMYSDEPACMQLLQYFIRDGKLDCVVIFRSNDAVKATFMNAFALIMLQKRIADELGVEMGSYTHRANSFHCYERDFDLLTGYCKRIEESLSSKDESAITYEYEDGWKDIMEEYIPEILDNVEKLKARKTTDEA